MKDLGYCKHGLLYCPPCLGARNPAAMAMIGRKAGPMKDRRKKRQKDKDRRDLKHAVEER